MSKSKMRSYVKSVIDPSYPIVGGLNAVIWAWDKLMNARNPKGVSNHAKDAVQIAHHIAAFCCAAGFVTPANAVKKVKDMNQVDVVAEYNLQHLIGVPDHIRLHWGYRRKAAHLLRCVNKNESFDPEYVNVLNDLVVEMLGSDSAHVIFRLIVITSCGKHYVFSETTRASLASVIWSTFMWTVIGKFANTYAGIMGVRYVKNAVRSRISEGRCLESLARQMKVSYSLGVAKYGYDRMTDSEKELVDIQVPDLEKEIDDATESEVPWITVLDQMNETDRLNFGTAWSMLPSPDTDPVLLNATIKEKYNAKRHIDYTAWDDFISYSMSSISANILVKFHDRPFEWDIGPQAEELE